MLPPSSSTIRLSRPGSLIDAARLLLSTCRRPSTTMPARSLRPCPHPGCSVLVARGRCEQHRTALNDAFNARRGSATKQGYNSKWQRARVAFLRDHPLCECAECGAGEIRATAATVVDHITPHRGDQELFWNQRNWQALSKRCHDRKTASEVHARRSGAAPSARRAAPDSRSDEQSSDAPDGHGFLWVAHAA